MLVEFAVRFRDTSEVRRDFVDAKRLQSHEAGHMASPRIVSIGRGEDIVNSLTDACRGLDGWVQATGVVEAVELRLVGDGADPVRAPRGRFALVALAGPAGGPYMVTLSRASEAGAEVWAGQLVRAQSDGVTVFIVPCEATEKVMPEIPAPKPNAAPTPTPAAVPAKVTPAAVQPKDPPPVAPAQSDWAKAALASAAVRRAAEAEHEPIVPEPGDLVQHFSFGLCEVLMGDDERLKIRDIDGPGRIREIRLDMLTVTGPRDREGKRLYRLERKN